MTRNIDVFGTEFGIVDAAIFVLDECAKYKAPMDVFKLQRMLYVANLEWIIQTNSELFYCGFAPSVNGPISYKVASFCMRNKIWSYDYARRVAFYVPEIGFTYRDNVQPTEDIEELLLSIVSRMFALPTYALLDVLTRDDGANDRALRRYRKSSIPSFMQYISLSELEADINALDIFSFENIS